MQPTSPAIHFYSNIWGLWSDQESNFVKNKYRIRNARNIEERIMFCLKVELNNKFYFLFYCLLHHPMHIIE